MNGWQQAISKASSVAHWTVNMCDNFVANMYGFAASGFTTAVDHWNSTPGNLKHPGDMNAPSGALMFWGGGAGHVAIADGQGGIYSTDISGAGTVSHVPATDISRKWGKPYLGWAQPYFQGQTGNTGTANATQASNTGSVLGGTVLDYLTNKFGTNVKDMAERVGLILMGALLVIVGLAMGPGKSVVMGLTNAKNNGAKAIPNSKKTRVREEEN